ncbi:aldehyde dehydrogenase family protein [Bacillus sp. SL00103]
MSQTLFIDGQWVGAKSGDTRDIINPFNQEVIATVSEGSRMTRTAIKAARKAFDQGDWANLPGIERGNMVFKMAELIRRDLDELAKLESLDTGKTLEESKADMDDIANVFPILCRAC